MGGTLFREFPELTRVADEILGYSIEQLCVEDPRNELGQTQFTQPALYVVNALSLSRRMNTGGDLPDMFAGHSLGEFNALMAAGCFDFATGLTLVKKRGELLGAVRGGAMAAIVNASSAEVSAILGEHGGGAIDIALDNTNSQTVISGPKEELARIEPFFRGGPIQYHPLNTSGAFHSRYMQPAAEEFAAYLAGISFAPMQKPVIANVTAAPHADGAIAAMLVRQITDRVRWRESVEYLLSFEGMQFEEIGHGQTLTKMVKAIGTAPRRPAAAPVSEARATSPADRVAAWNKAHRVGTKVRAKVLEGKELATRTEAMLLFGHRAAVYLDGYNGYFELDQVETVEAREHGQAPSAP
jgi:malonyl CoA-acyl carrier protein transacylase